LTFGPKAERLRRQVLSRLPMTLWMWKTLPLAAFAGLRVSRLDEASCSVRLPGGWRTQNPFRSTYFGAQAMAAEMLAVSAPTWLAIVAAATRSTRNEAPRSGAGRSASPTQMTSK